MPKLDVQHWLRTALAREFGPEPLFNLHEVGRDYHISPELEFPRTVSKWDMYLRLVSNGPTRASIRVRIHHRRRSRRWVLMNDYRSPHVELEFPSEHGLFHDLRIPIAQIRLESSGLYSISLYFSYDDEWVDSDGEEAMPWDPDEPGWSFGAVEYFRVVH